MTGCIGRATWLEQAENGVLAMKSGVILRWHMLGLRNAARRAQTDHARDVFVAGGAGLLLVIYNLASLYSSLSRAAPVLRAIWPRVAEGGITVTVLAGVLLGRFCRDWAEKRAEAPWLAARPWPRGAQVRAVRVACLAACGALLPLPALCGWGVSHAVQAAHEALAGPALALCFSASFAAGALPRRRTASRDDGGGFVRAQQAGGFEALVMKAMRARAGAA